MDINNLSPLPLNTFDEIPSPKGNAKTITALVKKGGSVTGYQLSDGMKITRSQGVQMAKSGEISGVGVAHKGNTEYLRSLPDGSDGNNLSSLPSVTE